MNELAPFQHRVIEDVDKYGISVLHVTDPSCPFFYSIGARANGLPDAIVCGDLPQNVGQGLINKLYLKASSNHRVIQLGLRLDLAKVPVVILPCEYDLDVLTSEYVVQAEYLYGENEFNKPYIASTLPKSSCKYLQIVWPDKQGAFPWEELYDPEFTQPTFIKPLQHAI